MSSYTGCYYTQHDKTVKTLLENYRFSIEIDTLKLKINTDKNVTIILDKLIYDEGTFIKVKWFMHKNYKGGLSLKRMLREKEGYLLNIIKGKDNKHNHIFILAMVRMHYMRLTTRQDRLKEMIDIEKSDLSYMLKEHILSIYVTKYKKNHVKQYILDHYLEEVISDLSYIIDMLDEENVTKSKIMFEILTAYNEIRLFDYFSSTHKIEIKHYRDYKKSIENNLKKVYSHSLGNIPYCSMQVPGHPQDIIYMLVIELEDLGLTKNDTTDIIQTISKYKRLPKMSWEIKDKYRHEIETKNKVAGMREESLPETEIWEYERERDKLFRKTYGHSNAYIQKIRK